MEHPPFIYIYIQTVSCSHRNHEFSIVFHIFLYVTCPGDPFFFCHHQRQPSEFLLSSEGGRSLLEVPVLGGTSYILYIIIIIDELLLNYYYYRHYYHHYQGEGLHYYYYVCEAVNLNSHDHSSPKSPKGYSGTLVKILRFLMQIINHHKHLD